ncbi:MAG: hypothetical protein J7K66_03940 [Anaerolineaceae bacterium]|nr:hypothetical protein [Anaerolineaceae bacterium]
MLKQFSPTTSPKRRLASSEYSRILSAAIINSHFRNMLLKDPAKAISNGYSGEQFDVNSEEKARLSTIQATSLADFAAQLSQI